MIYSFPLNLASIYHAYSSMTVEKQPTTTLSFVLSHAILYSHTNNYLDSDIITIWLNFVSYCSMILCITVVNFLLLLFVLFYLFTFKANFVIGNRACSVGHAAMMPNR